MKKRILIALLVAAMLLLTACNGGGNPPTPTKKDPVVTPVSEAFQVSEMKYSIYSNDESDMILPYRFYVPEDYNEDTAYPVFLFLHGAGERGTDNEAQLRNVMQILFNDLDSPIYQSIVIVPQCPGYHGDPDDYKWVDTDWEQGDYRVSEVEESEPMKLVVGLLEEIKADYSTNEGRYYVMGLSMGGYGTWDIIMRNTEMFAGAVPICGAGDSTAASRLVNLPIYAFHGDKDSVVPVEGTRAMVAAIKAAGGTLIQYDEVPNCDHNCWNYAAEKDGLIDWLFAQRRTK